MVPPFLLKILQMNSVSKLHWTAQNHLGQLMCNHDDPAQLVVATAPFLQAEAPAWWVAFDLVNQLDKELKQCDTVLRTARGASRIRLFRDHSNGRQVLQVDDDGVGMSRKTLSNDLLDFGKSCWASERASSEFPGIHAAKHLPIGRFGIGCVSIFMAAAKAKVFSRRFDRALQDVRCLSFDNGVSLRPILSDQRPKDFGMDVSTRVELELKPDVVLDATKIRIPCNISGQQPFDVPFNDYVAALLSGINVPISVELDAGAVQVHDGFPPTREHLSRWLRSLSYVPAGVNRPAEVLVDLVSPRLREIRDDEICYGLAALRVRHTAPHDFLSAKSVGGFVPHESGGAFVGLIDHLPNSAKREPGEIAAPRHAIDSWLSEQVDLPRSRLSPVDSVLASYSLCDFDYDPIGSGADSQGNWR